MNPILTVGIPTFNRGHLLVDCLKKLGPVLAHFNGQIELVISNNCSTDNTSEILDSFVKTSGGEFPIRIVEQTENIGAVPNIFQLVDAASTDYLISMGDDDSLKPDGLAKLLEILSASEPAHFIEGAWPWRLVQEEIELDQSDVSKWGYEIGLAWGSVYHVPSCRLALADSRLRSSLGSGIWGQIGMALVGIRLTGISAKVLPFSWGQIELERPFRYDYANLLWSLRDLIRCHLLAANSQSDLTEVKNFLTLSNFGFRSHLLGLVVESARLRGEASEKAYWSEIVEGAKASKSFVALFLVRLTMSLTEGRLSRVSRSLLPLARFIRRAGSQAAS
jgi:glycosyltransferase involved in cell wall biosynthesis